MVVIVILLWTCFCFGTYLGVNEGFCKFSNVQIINAGGNAITAIHPGGREPGRVMHETMVYSATRAYQQSATHMTRRAAFRAIFLFLSSTAVHTCASSP